MVWLWFAMGWDEVGDVTTAVKKASQSSQRAWAGLEEVVMVVNRWAAV